VLRHRRELSDEIQEVATDFSVCAQQLVVACFFLVKAEQLWLFRSCLFAFRTNIAPPKRRRFHHKKMDWTARGNLADERDVKRRQGRDRKSTRLNSSHLVISYAVFCL